MSTASYTPVNNVANASCPYNPDHSIAWSDDLPSDLKDLVLAPVSFTVFQDYEMRADRTQGHDAAKQACYCEFRFILTQLRSDDDEVFYEAPVYVETLTSWRLVDERWLVCRSTFSSLKQIGVQTSLTVSDVMPR
jgi:hypothetical protein